MTYGDTIAYYFLVFISRGFSSMPGMTRDISLDIKDGLLNRYLVQPLGLFLVPSVLIDSPTKLFFGWWRW
jgi:ABC-type uncharacterized transport system permease subunit